MEQALELQVVTADNLDALMRLSDGLTESQRRCVAHNAKSVAQGSLCNSSWYRVIRLGSTPIGFIMLDLLADDIPESDQPAIYLWRFMIGRAWQGQGYGRRALDQTIGHFGRQGVVSVYASCVLEEVDSPFKFYLKYGFEDTGRDEDGERILRYVIPGVIPDGAESVSDEGGAIRARPCGFIWPKLALVTVWTDDMAAMRHFYHRIMGFYIKQDLGDYVEFEHQGTRFALCRRTVMRDISPRFAEPATGQRFELAFPCDSPEELDKGWESLLRAGARPVAPPADMPWRQRAAFFADPDGNIHEIFAELTGE
jgi:catechol 2,3-dioxygenase-like lactoylglutathione lyase family enzyme/ribosomal protein S18 acetylase RimI-like enzyme